MSEIIINGGKKLSGEIKIQGAKNSVLPILAATLLCRGECIIHNCPNISDTKTSFDILENLGCKCIYEENTATINQIDASGYTIPEKLMREMRSSLVYLGAIIGRMGKAVISSPGGCELGPRPIDIHLSSLEKMGVEIEEDHGYIHCKTPKGLHGAEITLSFPSVGATENIILAAAVAKGLTVIHNAAKEPEISDLADFLNSAGARIYGSGSDTIYIHGVDNLTATEHTVIPDRIVAATYMSCVAMTGGMIKLGGVMPSHMVSILSYFRDCGVDIKACGKNITISAKKRIIRVPTIRSLVYPGFPTDAGPVIIASLSLAKGTSVFVENIFENRFRYIDELNRLGAKIKTEGKVAIIEGVEQLSGATCHATDLRGGAALVCAGLAAKGYTKISNTHHIERGYENIVEALESVGADIKFTEDE